LLGSPDRAMGPPGEAMGSRDCAFGSRGESMGSPDRAMGSPGDALGSRNRAFGPRGDAMGSRNRAMGPPGDALGSPGARLASPARKTKRGARRRLARSCAAGSAQCLSLKVTIAWVPLLSPLPTAMLTVRLSSSDLPDTVPPSLPLV